MEKMKHTPGPWKISDLNVDVDGEEDILIEHEGFPLCAVRGTNDMSCIDDDDEIERINNEVIANANLIATAPDLLEALEAFVTDIEGHPSVAAREHYGLLMAKAKEAIKKARGL